MEPAATNQNEVAQHPTIPVVPLQDGVGPPSFDVEAVIDTEQPLHESSAIDMVPIVSNESVIYQPQPHLDAQFCSKWGWNLKAYTDIGNAARLADRCGGDLRYCAVWKKWLVWDKRRWEVDRTGKVNEKAKAVLDEMRDMPRLIADQQHRYAKHVKRSSNKAGFNAMVELAQTIDGIPVMPDKLDADPWLLNCSNGTLDLRTGRLRDHSRNDLLTKIVDINYDAEATCPTFDAFLRKIMKDNPELIHYLQRIVGYCLTGDVGEKVMFILYGDGNNGKTTFLETIRHILGDYAGQVPIQSLMKKNWGEGIPNDIAQLQGKRFATSSETEAGQELAVAKIKQLTGLATVQARYLYAEFFEFFPTFKLFMDCNHKPTVPVDDPAIWNRLKFIPFTVTIPDTEIDRQMGKKLCAEAAGILAWAVRGCLEWQERGLNEPPEVCKATQIHHRDMDTVGRFLEDRCEIGSEFQEVTATLYAAHEMWCHETGDQPQSKKAFGMALDRIDGLQRRKNGTIGWQWHGIRLRPTPTNFGKAK